MGVNARLFEPGTFDGVPVKQVDGRSWPRMTPVEIAVEVIGWAGAVLILLAYLLLSAGKVTGQSIVYQAMNVVGAVGFTVNGWWHGAIPVSRAQRDLDADRSDRLVAHPRSAQEGT